jgi:hypothetical protein
MSNSNDYSKTSVSESTTYYYNPNKTYPEPCQYMLPCGYCKFLMRQCPKYYYTTTWASSNPTTKVNL